MGDYYKIKKILLILIIVLTIIRIFKTSNVFAAEDVNSSILSGNYVVQTDNHYETIKNISRDAQNIYCNQLLYLLNNDNSSANTINTINTIFTYYINKNNTLWFYTVSSAGGFLYQVIPLSYITSSNITISGYTWDNSYNFNNVPFLQFTRNSNAAAYYINPNTGITYVDANSGASAIAPIPAIGFLSPLWAEVFKQAGIISSTSYEDILSSIEETLEQDYTANYYTKQAVQNTYSYLTNDNIEEITSLGISQPQVTEQVDLTDVLDSLEALLTNETYTTKFFTITLPNGRGSTFALSPELLENNLNRVGGQNIVSIIHAVWYIGLYGWYIFSLLGIYGKLLTGDLFHLVKGCSPVTNLVKMSVGTISGGKF